MGLALAYFGFRRGLPLSFRSVFYPLIGDRIHGPIGNAIDVMAVLATLFGLATSLGLGAKQVNAGLNYVFGLPQGIGIQDKYDRLHHRHGLGVSSIRVACGDSTTE